MLRSRPLRNVGYLSIAQVSNLLIPMFTLPWVLRTLAPAGYGQFVFWQAIVQYLILLVDFGFYLSATKRISEMPDDFARVTRLFWTIQAARALIAVAVMLCSAVAVFLIADVRDHAAIFVASLVAVPGILLVPLWLFAGLERMGAAAIATLMGRLVTLPLIFLFVHDPSHVWRLALITSLGTVAGGLVCIFLIVRWRLVGRWIAPAWAEIRDAYRHAWHFFVTSASSSLYSAANPIMLGLVSTTAQVGLFSAADRVRAVSLTPVHPVFNAFYPVVSRTFLEDPRAAGRLLLRLLALLGGGTLLISVTLWIAAPLVTRILMGAAFEDAVGIIRIMAAVPFVIGINTVVGSLGMMATGMHKQASRIILICGAVNLSLLALLGYRFGASGAAASLLITETLVAIVLSITFLRNLSSDVFATRAT
jgi:O-antigen/teichoic acid export membrane protein